MQFVGCFVPNQRRSHRQNLQIHFYRRERRHQDCLSELRHHEHLRQHCRHQGHHQELLHHERKFERLQHEHHLERRHIEVSRYQQQQQRKVESSVGRSLMSSIVRMAVQQKKHLSMFYNMGR